MVNMAKVNIKNIEVNLLFHHYNFEYFQKNFFALLVIIWDTFWCF